MNLVALKEISVLYKLSVPMGDVLFLGGRWYVTHAGLLRLARRKSCAGIHVQAVPELCNVAASRWGFKAVVYTHESCRGFVGYGDADPSNVSSLIHGAEMRLAETRAVNRALRKAYGIGICSVEELGASAEPAQSRAHGSKLPPQPAAENSGGLRVRDRLYQIIRQHQLDPNLVKSYAADFCGVETLREATRDEVEKFVTHLADWAMRDHDALLGQLNSYLPAKGNAA